MDVNEQIGYFEDLLSGPRLSLMQASDLLLAARKFSKIEEHYREKHSKELLSKRIAVLASNTTYHFISVLKLFLYKEGISPVFYEGEYDGIAMGLLDTDSEVYSFRPEILLLLTDQKDIKEFPQLFADQQVINDWVETNTGYYINLWNHASTIPGCQIFQTTFVLPLYRPLGNMEGSLLFSMTNSLKLLNQNLIQKKPQNVTFVDMDYLSSYIGKRQWFDDKNYYLSKQGFSFDVFGLVCKAFSKIISSHAGNVRKCLVLDLDNTLWGGVIGDDGVDGINLNSSDAVGEAFIAFQKYLKKLKERGVILAVCSKNDEETAKIPFEKHPEMILSLNDIAIFQANWENKVANIQEIGRSLNIGIDSLVFFDDNPFERDIVRKYLPLVQVIDVPEDPARYIHALDSAMCFEWSQLTDEDLLRSDTYITDRKRQQLSSTVVDYDSYLQALEMKTSIRPPAHAEIPRFAQLINKSNQFNLRTRRYSDAAISQMMMDQEKYTLLGVTLEDKFGKYGIISCIILAHHNDSAFIDTWVMSCRVLKRGVEHAVFNAICEYAHNWGCQKIIGEYIPTKKNHMVSNLLEDLGFHRSDEILVKTPGEDCITYEIDLATANRKKHHISIDIS